jgi:chlorophyll synthase
MALPQAAVIGLLLAWERPVQAFIVVVLLAVQFALMTRFLRDPLGRATWYSGIGVPFFVSGMMAAAFALRALFAAGT